MRELASRATNGKAPGTTLTVAVIAEGALHIADGSVAWSYQTTHHDVWDYDLPAQPTLGTVTYNGKTVPAVLQQGGTVVQFGEEAVILQVSHDQLQSSVQRALTQLPLRDLTVEDPPLEEVMRELFARGAKEGAA